MDPRKLAVLMEGARGFVDRGELSAIQVAVARHGRLAGTGSFGKATFSGTERPVDDSSLFTSYSITKALVASAIWLLVEEEKLAEDQRVVDWIPEFAGEGKEDVRIGQLLTHTAGFPGAAFSVLDWPDRRRRLARFASWRLEFEPGTRMQYHPTSASWVLAELIERCTGQDYRAFAHRRVLEPLGIEDLFLGLPDDRSQRVADVIHVGDPASAEELARVGLDRSVDRSTDETYLSGYNRRDWRAVGAPGSGAIATAAAWTQLFQALLAGGVAPAGARVWQAATISSGLRIRTGDLVDPMTGMKANRCLGLVIAGDESRVYRGFSPSHSPAAFAHAGVGGQLAWGDPATGISFAVLSNSLERHPVRMAMRNLMLSRMAAECSA